MDNEYKNEYLKKIEDLEKELENLKKRLKYQKKYGLFWDKEIIKEEVVENCEYAIPVLKQINNKKILNKGDYNKDNIIIQGDNFHSLTALNLIFKDSIDIIYIDPPYNTGNEDFIYNDKYVDKDDGYKHSKWLNFMSARLNLAKELLNDNGVIFISINEIELANLTLLCNRIFGENNFISSCFVLDNLKGKTNDKFITKVGSRLLVYAKNKIRSSIKKFNYVENIYGKKFDKKFKFQDNEGYYELITFKKTGHDSSREKRPSMFYPILEREGKLYSITQDEFKKIYNSDNKSFNDDFISSDLRKKYKDYNFILPQDENGNYLRWTSSFNTFNKKINKEILFKNDIKQKKKPKPNEEPEKYEFGTPKSFMYKPKYSTGTDDLKKVIGENKFSFPKSVELIKDILKLIPNKNAKVLDFFAGSGTTGQAVLELNKEDKGSRSFILCTNNENNICSNITYPRLKTVITGTKDDGSKFSDGIYANLFYFITDFAEKDEHSDQAKYNLAEKVDSLLCILENIYIEENRNDFSSHFVSEKKDRHLFIYKDLSHTNEKFEEFKRDVLNNKGEKIVYIFSFDEEELNYLFDKKEKEIIVKPMPAKIYKIYKKIVEEIKGGTLW